MDEDEFIIMNKGRTFGMLHSLQKKIPVFIIIMHKS